MRHAIFAVVERGRVSGWIRWNGDTETVECRFWSVGSTSGDGGNLQGRRVELGVVERMSLILFWLFLWNNLRRWSIWLMLGGDGYEVFVGVLDKGVRGWVPSGRLRLSTCMG